MEIIKLDQNSSCFVIEPIRTDSAILLQRALNVLILPVAKSSKDASKAFHCLLQNF